MSKTNPDSYIAFSLKANASDIGDSVRAIKSIAHLLRQSALEREDGECQTCLSPPIEDGLLAALPILAQAVYGKLHLTLGDEDWLIPGARGGDE